MAHDTVVNLGTEIRHSSVIEIRYPNGQLYWDRAGRISHEILRRHPEFEIQNVDANAFRIVDTSRNIAFSFGPMKLDLQQSQNEDNRDILSYDEFSVLAEELSDIVLRSLSIEIINRVGYRVHHLFSARDRRHADALVYALDCFQSISSLSSELGSGSDPSMRQIVERDTNSVRVAVTTFEQNIQISQEVIAKATIRARSESRQQKQVLVDQLKAKRLIKGYPQFGMLVDLDAFIDTPPPQTVTATSFIANAEHDFNAMKPIILRGTAPT